VKRVLLSVAAAVVFSAPAGAVPIVGGSGLTPNAAALAEWARATFPAITSIGGVRQDQLPDHPSGRAIDLMVPNLAVGDEIYAAVMANQARFNVRYVMWRVADHFNHIHVTVD
jgi:hypothetical protein